MDTEFFNVKNRNKTWQTDEQNSAFQEGMMSDFWSGGGSVKWTLLLSVYPVPSTHSKRKRKAGGGEEKGGWGEESIEDKEGKGEEGKSRS